MRQDRRINLDDLCILIPEVSRSTIGRTLTEKLEYRKVCARWVPRMLTEDHQRQRTDSSREFLQRYADENDNFLDSTVTGDETWAFHFTPETKQQSREWRHSSSPKPRKFKTKVCRQTHGNCVLGSKGSIVGRFHGSWDHNKR